MEATDHIWKSCERKLLISILSGDSSPVALLSGAKVEALA